MCEGQGAERLTAGRQLSASLRAPVVEGPLSLVHLSVCTAHKSSVPVNVCVCVYVYVCV